MNSYTNQDAHNDITAQFKLFKRTKTDRDTRIAFSDQLVERYFRINDKIPPTSVLERLATLILQDELADRDVDKMSKTKYPILSENQYRRRTEGRHKRRLTADGKLRPLEREVPFSLAYNIASDGKDYSYPKRRNIDVIEQLDIEHYGSGGGSYDN